MNSLEVQRKSTPPVLSLKQDPEKSFIFLYRNLELKDGNYMKYYKEKKIQNNLFCVEQLLFERV